MSKIFVFRKERAVTPVSMDAPVLGGVVLRSWSVAKGDRILLIAGRGMETRFLATASVAGVQTREATPAEVRESYPRTPEAKAHRYSLETVGWKWLESITTLGQMMYSLERVSNFSRPYLHFRHQGTATEADVQAILTLSIDSGRSLYFGLLQHLPEMQRKQLDLMCRQQLALDQTDFDPAKAARRLLTILGDQVGAADDLARKIGQDREELGLSVPLVAAEEDADEWTVDRLIRHAMSDRSAMARLLQELSDAGNEVTSERSREWRPHRW